MADWTNQELARKPQAQDLKRFASYARRILQLTYHHRLPGTLHPLNSSMISQMSAVIPDLFPNLQCLYFASVDIEGWYTLPYICCPRITHLALDLQHETVGPVDVYHKTIRNVLSMCRKIIMNLKTLVVKTKSDSTGVTEVCTEVVQYWQEVRKLQVPLGGMTLPATFYQLCLMKDLVVADFRIDTSNFDHRRMRIPLNPFPHLRILHLESTIAFFLPIIQAIRSTYLNSLRLVFREHTPCPTELFYSLIQATCGATSSLQVLDLLITAPSSRRMSSGLPTAATLLPLFAHRKLEELVIDFGVPMILCDADIDTMAHMWPKLTRLGLTTRNSPSGSTMPRGAGDWAPKMTCRAITTLLFHLHHLVHLSIDFDASSLDSMLTGPEDENLKLSRGKGAESIRTNELKVLDVSRSIPGSPLYVASWMSVLCPKLKEVKWNGENESWNRTNSVLQKIREMGA